MTLFFSARNALSQPARVTFQSDSSSAVAPKQFFLSLFGSTNRVFLKTKESTIDEMNKVSEKIVSQRAFVWRRIKMKVAVDHVEPAIFFDNMIAVLPVRSASRSPDAWVFSFWQTKCTWSLCQISVEYVFRQINDFFTEKF